MASTKTFDLLIPCKMVSFCCFFSYLGMLCIVVLLAKWTS